MIEEDEYMEVSEDFSALAQLDERDKKVKEAVVAYLMYHSGLVLDSEKYPDIRSRAKRIDELGELAIERSELKEQYLQTNDGCWPQSQSTHRQVSLLKISP